MISAEKADALMFLLLAIIAVRNGRLPNACQYCNIQILRSGTQGNQAG